MPLSAGTKLGSYEILSPICAGGMGEVYQARDTKLGREVAIKVLPAEFAHDPERLSRFQREAKILASLNHPNIAAIYGLEENAGTSYLVMELVPGETLAERIKRGGAIPEDETLTIARQMAQALEAAHERGVVHRDLKPANVKVTPDGKVKVLDFGLAKAFSDDDSNQDLTTSPTMSAATMQGVILGTAAYMSPEQARGKSTDKRADIWAFGVVVYEMLTGRQLFAGETVCDLLAAVLRHEPDYGRLPAPMQRFLRWCLEKDPKKRLRDIEDGMALLEERPDEEVSYGTANATPIWPWAIAAAACLIAAGLALVLLRAKTSPAPEAYRLTIRLPENVTFRPSAALTLSPDGHRVAFPAVDPDGRTSVWVQDMDGEEAKALSGTNPIIDSPPFFWSPDSRYIVFPSEAKIRKVDVLSGTIQDICDKTVLPIGGSWNRYGVIILGSISTGLLRVPAEGGTPVPLTVLDASRHESEHELPSFLPDGRHFLYLVDSSDPENTGLYVGSLDDPPERQSKKRLLATRYGATYVPSGNLGAGHLVFLLDGVLMAQVFDPDKFELVGDPAPVSERVGSAFETGHFSVTPTVLVYRGQAPAPDFQFTWLDTQGKVVGKVGDPAGISTPRLSPDGSRVAFMKFAANVFNGDVWLLDLKQNSSTRFTFGPGASENPVWSPDGSEIVFSSNRDGAYNLYRKPVDGTRTEQLLLRTSDDKQAFSWSRDGSFLLYGANRNFGAVQMSVLPMRGEPNPISFSHSRFDERDGEFSPDGRWIAYESNETGQYEVYVRAFDGSADAAETGGKWMVSKDGGMFPRWRSDGRELAYISLDRTTIMSLTVDTDRVFQPGVPRQLVKVPADRGNSLGVAPTPDLKRFLMPIAVEVKVPQSFTVMLNWASLVKK